MGDDLDSQVVRGVVIIMVVIIIAMVMQMVLVSGLIQDGSLDGGAVAENFIPFVTILLALVGVLTVTVKRGRSDDD